MKKFQDLSNITAAILVGGLGIRLRSVISDKPKVMADIRQKPFLTYVLDQLSDAGIQRVILCTGYLGEQVHSFFRVTYKNLLFFMDVSFCLTH